MHKPLDSHSKTYIGMLERESRLEDRREHGHVVCSSLGFLEGIPRRNEETEELQVRLRIGCCGKAPGRWSSAPSKKEGGIGGQQVRS